MSYYFPSYRLYPGRPPESWQLPSAGDQGLFSFSSDDPLEFRASEDSPLEEAFSLSGLYDKKATQACPCGYLGDPVHPCTCTLHEIRQYRKRLSGPFLDRIDLFVQVPRLTREELVSRPRGESSEAVRTRVIAARRIQWARMQGSTKGSNAQLTPKEIAKYCELTKDAERLLEMAIDRFGLSARAYTRVLKVARTIADLDGEENIVEPHIAEAIQYRAIDEDLP